MSVTKQSIMDTRRHQMFPTLEPAEIERVRRFGKVRSYGVGEALARVGEVGPWSHHHLGWQGRYHPALRIGSPRANRHSRRGRIHGRTGATGGADRPGRWPWT